MAASTTLRDNIAAEVVTFRAILFSRVHLASKMLLALAFLYPLSPWEIIPDTVPVWGYADDLCIFVAGIVLARLLAPAQPSWLRGAALAGRSEMLAMWLALQRWFWQAKRGLANGPARAGKRFRGAFAAPDLGQAAFRLLGYRFWWMLRLPTAPRRSVLRNLIVVGGAPRSGTTLLRVMLDRHPMIAARPETTVFLQRISSPADIASRTGLPARDIEAWQRASRSQPAFIEHMAAAVLAQSGKTVWAEKTPHNVLRFGFVRRRFPHAKLVHIIRDGRDVVCSLRREPFSKIEGKARDSSAAALRCAAQWRHAVRAGMRFRGDAAYHELRYEDLVRDPEGTTRSLFAFLELPWSPLVLRPSGRPAGDAHEAKAAGSIVGASVARWEADLNAADRAATRALIGPLVEELGYRRGIDY